MESIQWHPGKIMEISGSYWQTCTLHAAIKLDLFSAIADTQRDADTLARSCSGLEELRQLVAHWPAERTAAATGISPEQLRQLGDVFGPFPAVLTSGPDISFTGQPAFFGHASQTCL